MPIDIGRTFASICGGSLFKSGERKDVDRQGIEHASGGRAPMRSSLLESARAWLEKRFGGNIIINKPAVVKDVLFQVKNDFFKKQAQELSNAWPANWPKDQPDVPPEFHTRAFLLQIQKESMFETSASSGGMQKTNRLQAAIRISEVAHGKPGHTARGRQVPRRRADSRPAWRRRAGGIHQGSGEMAQSGRPRHSGRCAGCQTAAQPGGQGPIHRNPHDQVRQPVPGNINWVMNRSRN